MPPTPDEALSRNKGQRHLQLEKAIRDLLDEVEAALECYVGEPLYVGLPSFIEYRAEADQTVHSKPNALEIVDGKLHEKFREFGWKFGIVTNATASQYWVKIQDARTS